MKRQKMKFTKLRLHPVQYLVLFYLITVLAAAIFFYLPFSQRDGVHLSFIDALFTATSAVSGTGLSVVNIYEKFNTLGTIGMLFFLQVGGLGVMALSTFVWLVARKRIGIKERRLIMTDQNRLALSGIVYTIRNVSLIFIMMEIIGAILLGFSFIPYFDTVGEAFFQGLFLAVSSFTNSGFDLMGNSLVPFHQNYFVQIVVMVLIITGAIGFPVWIEIKEYIRSRKKRQYRFSLYTKITGLTTFGLVVAGTVGLLIFERNGAFQGMVWHEAFFYALFQSVTTRSAGLMTMNLQLLSSTSILLLSLLMFVGASPSSAGGGIRTTTFALNILSLYHFAKGHRKVRIFRRELMNDDLSKAATVTMMATMLCAAAVMILTHTEPFTLEELLFEVMSAFGTTGLSLGITSELSFVGRIVMIVLMFIGRVGIISTLYVLGRKTDAEKANYHYPEERIIIG